MTTEDALLAAVLAAPDDDLLRLVLADHYEGELGQPDRAEFIRVQCELAKVPVKTFGPDEGKEELRHMNLKRRERELWDAGVYAKYREDVPTTVHVLLPGWTSCSPIEAHPRRGFITEVRSTLADWCGGECDYCQARGGYENNRFVRWDTCTECKGEGTITGIGPQIVKRHPVTTVVLTGVVVPSAVQGSPFGAVTRESAGPLFDVAFKRAITSRVEGHAEELATIMSAAAIDWAKSQPTHAVYHGDGQAYRIVPTGA